MLKQSPSSPFAPWRAAYQPRFKVQEGRGVASHAFRAHFSILADKMEPIDLAAIRSAKFSMAKMHSCGKGKA